MVPGEVERFQGRIAGPAAVELGEALIGHQGKVRERQGGEMCDVREDTVQKHRVREFFVATQVKMREVASNNLKQFNNSVITERVRWLRQFEGRDVGQSRYMTDPVVRKLPDLTKAQLCEVGCMSRQRFDTFEIKTWRLSNKETAELGAFLCEERNPSRNAYKEGAQEFDTGERGQVS